MSRSRRQPIITDGYKGSFKKRHAKRQANKKVRKSVEVLNGTMYKKLYCSWNICDYKIFLIDPAKKVYEWDGHEEWYVDWYNKAQRK